ncbi:isoprenyl transferase [Desulfitobacterium sp.]|uniref:isoprenyl transferase n=1 Tax=Desulfitobacterium sp. TaxID=49981 RepID=UPI002C3EFAE1|nr:isoprenyl transferase [Desulfitobacterium sp.]HVJ47772.1 isoprenyl transferase [Desulfitobacterium sp.]
MWLNFRNKDKEVFSSEKIDLQHLPRHIAIIMDGNGRWAKKRGLPRKMGHSAGVEALRDVVKTCSNLGVEVLTVYAFSTENWRRPKEEVGILMSLLTEYLRRELRELHENKVKIKTLGDISLLPIEAQKELVKATKQTESNSGLILNLALNYGGRAEITRALRKLGEEILQGKLTPEEIDEQRISSSLYTADLPDPDLLIRTSGEMRLSNFMLWQLAYTEIVVTEQLWPDFNPQTLLAAIKTYQQRERRFGGINKE